MNPRKKKSVNSTQVWHYAKIHQTHCAIDWFFNLNMYQNKNHLDKRCYFWEVIERLGVVASKSSFFLDKNCIFEADAIPVDSSWRKSRDERGLGIWFYPKVWVPSDFMVSISKLSRFICEKIISIPPFSNFTIKNPIKLFTSIQKGCPSWRINKLNHYLS